MPECAALKEPAALCQTNCCCILWHQTSTLQQTAKETLGGTAANRIHLFTNSPLVAACKVQQLREGHIPMGLDSLRRRFSSLHKKH